MRRKWSLLGAIFLTASSCPAQARDAVGGSAPPYARAPSSLALAKEIADTEVSREQFDKRMAPVEKMLALSAVSALAANNPEIMNDSDTAAKVAAIVHNSVSSVYSKVMDARASAYAETFSKRELTDIVSFIRGPGGQAEKINIPLLKADLSPLAMMSATDAANMEVAADQTFVSVSPSRRELVLRIFKPQNVEERTRRGYAILLTRLSEDPHKVDSDATTPGSNANPRAKASEDEVARFVDEYVRKVMAVEKRFYANHYSDADLSIIATYLESETGRLTINRSPAIERAAAQITLRQFVSVLASLDEAICSAVICSSEQRARLVHLTSSVGAAIPQFGNVPF